MSSPQAIAVDDYGLATVPVCPQAMLAAGVGSVVEGDSGTVELNVPVTLSNPSSQSISVDYATLGPVGDGLAAAGLDFEPVSGTLTFAPGQTEDFITVQVLGDELDEIDALYGEWIVVQLSNPTAGATIDANAGLWGLGIGIIIDDD